MSQRQLDQLPNLSQLPLATSNIIIADFIEALVIIPLKFYGGKSRIQQHQRRRDARDLATHLHNGSNELRYINKEKHAS